MLLHELSRGRIWDAFRDMERLQTQLNNLLNTVSPESAPDFPPINIWVSENGAIVSAEIPGVDPAEIDISIVQETLTLRGTRNLEPPKDAGTYHRRERGTGSFARTVELPFRVNGDGVEAKFCSGILCITLPRAEQDKPRKISVKSE